MTTTHVTDEQRQAARSKAAEAIRDYYSGPRDSPSDAWSAERRARDKATAAVCYYGVTAAQLASDTGLRQLLIATLIDDDRARAQALVAARVDADRYRDQVYDAMRIEALREIGRGAKDADIVRLLNVNRHTVAGWRKEAQTQEEGN